MRTDANHSKAYQESLARLQAKVRAYQQSAANIVTAYEAMSYEQRMAACDLVESREGRRTFRISELVAANEELKAAAQVPYKPFLEAEDVWSLRKGVNPAFEVFENTRNDGHEISIIQKIKKMAEEAA